MRISHSRKHSRDNSGQTLPPGESGEGASLSMNSSVVVGLGLLKSYQDVGAALVGCSGGCDCKQRRFELLHRQQVSACHCSRACKQASQKLFGALRAQLWCGQLSTMPACRHFVPARTVDLPERKSDLLSVLLLAARMTSACGWTGVTGLLVLHFCGDAPPARTGSGMPHVHHCTTLWQAQRWQQSQGAALTLAFNCTP